MEQSVKTGTTTIAVKYNNGVIISADKRATVGNMIADDNMSKVYQLNDNMALTIAGMAADAVLFTRHLKSEIRLNELRIHRRMSVKEVAELLSSFQYSALRSQGSIVHYVLAGKDETGFHIFDVFPDGSVGEKEHYWTSGSGSTFVLGVLENNFREGMSEADGIGIVKQGFRASMRHDAASGSGVDVYRITDAGVQHVETVRVDAAIPA